MNQIDGLDVEITGFEIEDYCRVRQDRHGVFVTRWSRQLGRITNIRPGAKPGLVLF